VKCGTFLVREGLLLPPESTVLTQAYSPGWRVVSEPAGTALDHDLRKSGWSCFFLAGELKSMSFGSAQGGNLNRAMGKLLAQVKSQGFNCAELTRVTKSRFLGIPYISVRGHSRHIQQGCQIDCAEDRKHQQSQTDWAVQ
jgi:hypothetical protein